MPKQTGKPAQIKRRKTTVSTRLKRDIHSAAAQIPSLIAANAGYLPGRKPSGHSSHPLPVKKSLLWGGVGALAILVFVMWTWNMRAFIGTLPHKKNIEGELFRQAKHDISTIMTNAEVSAALSDITHREAPAAGHDAPTQAALAASVAALLSAPTTTESNPATKASSTEL